MPFPSIQTPWGSIAPIVVDTTTLRYEDMSLTPTGVTLTVTVSRDAVAWTWQTADHRLGGTGFPSAAAALTHLSHVLTQQYGTFCSPISDA
ncbi:hypothetical protein [Sulfobacillus sp. hq2]|uniref:hypothetical protein n=1 Tax=Sulfobacillus sp. hq2 TaxID=2039167 RepID=UPI000CD271F1|nr:hypothetical protein [Sulfobacillus sp. hq2]POB12178.1 hypothetical protein CO251_00700 [Sulfobacillus sp. hq2]